MAGEVCGLHLLLPAIHDCSHWIKLYRHTHLRRKCPGKGTSISHLASEATDTDAWLAVLQVYQPSNYHLLWDLKGPAVTCFYIVLPY
ncbi:hypothetical protein FKM82_008242 [Ascaphus truei]